MCTACFAISAGRLSCSADIVDALCYRVYDSFVSIPHASGSAVSEWTVTAFGVSKTAVLHFMVQAVFFVILFLSVFQSMSLTGKAARSNFGIPCRKVQNVPRFPQEDHWIATVQVK